MREAEGGAAGDEGTGAGRGRGGPGAGGRQPGGGAAAGHSAQAGRRGRRGDLQDEPRQRIRGALPQVPPQQIHLRSQTCIDCKDAPCCGAVQDEHLDEYVGPFLSWVVLEMAIPQ